METLIGFIVTLVIIFAVPVMVYGLFSVVFGLDEPNKKIVFMVGVLIQKVGTALGFVTLFYLGKDYFVINWTMYALAWFVMFALTEIGQVIMSDYNKKEAIAGIVSEAIYFPAAAYTISRLLN